MALLCEACGAAVPKVSGDADIIDGDESPSGNHLSSTKPQFSRKSAPAHYDEFDDFAVIANGALHGAFPVHNRPHDSKVGVLLLSFEDDDLGVIEEIKELHQVFEKDYGYEVEHWLIPVVDSQKELSNKLYEFRATYHRKELAAYDTLPLLIVYYAGHAKNPYRGASTCLWTSNETSSCASLNWTEVQPVIFGASADVLLLLDCCYASSATWRAATASIGSKETIAACGPHSIASGVGYRSFTSALVSQLKLQANRAPILTAAALHGHLLQSDYRLKYQPTYARSHRNTRHSAALNRLRPGPFKGGLGLVTSMTATPKLPMVQVLLAIHIKGDLNEDTSNALLHAEGLIPFLRNESALPTSVVGMNVEGVRQIHHAEAAFRGF